MTIRDNIGGFIPKVYGGTTLEKNKSVVDNFSILIQHFFLGYPSEMVMDPN